MPRYTENFTTETQRGEALDREAHAEVRNQMKGRIGVLAYRRIGVSAYRRLGVSVERFAALRLCGENVFAPSAKI